MSQDPFQNNSQFTISYELLCLMQWLCENDAEKIKKIIGKGLENGLKERMQRTDDIDANESIVTEDIQYSIIEFFGLLETLLIESVNELAVKKALEKNLMPAIEQIDTHACDDATVKNSIERATHKLEINPKENPKELLCIELLKRWKPLKKQFLN